MWTTDEFATGFVPAWDSGIVFFAEYDEESDWIPNLKIHRHFFDPIVLAVTFPPLPRLLRDFFYWSDGYGVTEALECIRLDIEELVQAFSKTTPEGLGQNLELYKNIISDRSFSKGTPTELRVVLHDLKPSVGDCLRCIKAIQRFISEVLASGSSVFIESW